MKARLSMTIVLYCYDNSELSDDEDDNNVTT
jgi:hypothetical protein